MKKSLKLRKKNCYEYNFFLFFYFNLWGYCVSKKYKYYEPMLQSPFMIIYFCDFFVNLFRNTIITIADNVLVGQWILYVFFFINLYLTMLLLKLQQIIATLLHYYCFIFSNNYSYNHILNLLFDIIF